MHCVSCEVLIEKELKDYLKEVKINISHKKGSLSVEADNFDDKKIKELIEKLGYKIIEENESQNENNREIKKSKFTNLLEIILVFVILFFIFSLISKLNLTKFFPDISGGVSFIIALIVGFVASLSTCLAITGGIVMSFSSQYKIDANNREKKSATLKERSLPQLYFHAGRIGGFFLLGGLLGSLGGIIRYSTSLAGFLTILVALIMLYIGLNIMGLLPNITKLGFYLPKRWSHGILNLKTKNKPLLISAVGAFTFFLPCGFTQSMQLAAISSGGFMKGALIMAFFALGTMPILFSVGIGSSYAQNKNLGLLKKLIAAIVIVFSIYSLNSGLILSGSKFSINFWNNISSHKESATSNIDNKNSDYQTVQLDIDYTFKQKELRIKKGIPVKFVVNPIRITGCSDEVIIPRFNLSTGKLKPGTKKTLEFTPTESGIIPFSCSMGMINGKFIVE